MLGQSMVPGRGEEPDKIYSQQFSVLNSQLVSSPEGSFSQVHLGDSSNMFLLVLGPSVPVSRRMKVVQTFNRRNTGEGLFAFFTV